MILAALGPIHGDAAALARALEAIDAGGIFTIVHTGNSAAGGPGAAEVMRVLEARGIPCAQGPDDRMTGRFRRAGARLLRTIDPAHGAALEAACNALPAAALERLLARPRELRLAVDGVRVLVCGGVPGRPQETIGPGTPMARLERLREEANADIVVCGGASASFACHAAGTLFVAPAPLADGYAVIDTGAVPWRVDFVRNAA